MLLFGLDCKYILYYLMFLVVLILFKYCYVLGNRFFTFKTKQESNTPRPLVVAALTTLTTPIHINVGGTQYTSCLQTLTKCPSSRLASMFNGTEPIDVDVTNQCYFLDRDGKMFRHILNFLRNAELVLPESFSESALLLKEASFFQIEELCTALTEKLSGGNEKVKAEVSDVGVDGDIQTEENIKKTGKEQAQSKSVNKNDNKSYEASEIKSEHLKEEPKREAILTNNNLPEVGLLANNLSPSSDIVCVFTDCTGVVMELWSSDSEFTIEFPTDDSYYPLNTTNKFYGKKYVPSKAISWDSDRFCRRCLVKTNTNDDKLGFCRFCYNFLKWDFVDTNKNHKKFEQIHIQLSWMAKYLFRKNYKLLSSCSFDSERYSNYSFKDTVLYHCFVR